MKDMRIFNHKKNSETIKLRVAEIRNFDELYSLIRQVDIIPDDSRTWTCVEIISIIEEFRRGKTKIDNVTKTFGLRDKVAELKKMEQFSKFYDEYFYNSKEQYFQFIFSKDSQPVSGWKLHIYAENVDDSVRIYEILANVLYKNEISCKFATDEFYHMCDDERHRQYGKGCAIYLPVSYFHRGVVGEVLETIHNLLQKGGYLKRGRIKGDKHFEGSIHYRYEANIPMLFCGFNTKLYHQCYKENDGVNYNIKSNFDLFETIKFRQSCQKR